MFLSIIIPTYRNTKEEIERCLGSIYQSDWRDFEVLLVDDGNTAEYAAYLDTLSARFAGLCILHLPHGGVSAARNAAVSEAQGEYILFSDADDIVTKQFWEDAKEISARGIEADIIYGMVVNRVGKTQFGKGGESLSLRELDEEEKRELYAYFFALQRKQFWTKDGHIGRGSVARLVRKESAQKTLFDTRLSYGEDLIWNLDLLKTTPRVYMADHVWYIAMENPESASRGYREDAVERIRNHLLTLRRYVTADTEPDYRQRVCECLVGIARKYYLSPKNPLPRFSKVRAFNRVTRSEPFCEIYKSTLKEDGAKQYRIMMLCKWGLLLYKYEFKRIFSPRKIKNWVKILRMSLMG